MKIFLARLNRVMLCHIEIYQLGKISFSTNWRHCFQTCRLCLTERKTNNCWLWSICLSFFGLLASPPGNHLTLPSSIVTVSHKNSTWLFTSFTSSGQRRVKFLGTFKKWLLVSLCVSLLPSSNFHYFNDHIAHLSIVTFPYPQPSSFYSVLWNPLQLWISCSLDGILLLSNALLSCQNFSYSYP